ncbi:MAG: ABC transporter ATP-binding protein [Hormoscilla sp.]
MAKSKLQKLGAYMRPHWKPVSLGIAALFIVNALGVYIPLQIRNTIDRLQTNFDFSQVMGYVAIVFLLACIMWVIRIASRLLIFGVGRLVEFDLKQSIFRHLLTLEPSYFAANKVGDLINRATSDVDNIRRLVGFAVLSLANMLFAYSLTLPLMMSINIRLTLFAIAVYPFMLVIVQLFSHRLRSQQEKVQEELSRVSDLIQEDMSGMSLIKIYAQEENERHAFRQFNQKLLEANLRLARTRYLLFPLIEALANVSLLVLMWLGTSAIARGTITIGDFLALLLYAERLVFPTALLGFTLSTYQRGQVSVDRIESIFQVEPKIKDLDYAAQLTTKVRGQIVAQHLNYTYPGAQTPALKDVNFAIKPGETVAIVGPIGAGKSTLANALPRLLDIPPRTIFLDGYDITLMKLDDLRGAIAYVPQDSFLFSTTIKNNIRYGDPVLEGIEIEIAARQAQMHSEIGNFPQQYETIVGERGVTLSGGQRQRTSLARALFVDAPVLILDDALSSVDNQTATNILRNLSKGTKRQTVIFISHQMSAAATADRILVMDRGAIVQIGTHAELLQQPGLYQNLWQQQQLEALLQ